MKLLQKTLMIEKITFSPAQNGFLRQVPIQNFYQQLTDSFPLILLYQ